MRVLIDTNVIIDFIADRQPFSESAFAIMNLCVNSKITGFIAAHTIANIFYILRKSHSIAERKDILFKICNIFDVVGIDIAKLESALTNEDFTDFEDCLQFECAKDANADYIVTRNVGDFSYSSVTAIESAELLKLIK